jgi:hypothetical protein
LDDGGYWIDVDGDYCGDDYAAFPLDTWTNVTVTWNGKTGECAFYLDGKVVVGPVQSDECKKKISAGGTFVLGGKKKKPVGSGLISSTRFIGSVVNMQMWPFVFTACQLRSLWEGAFQNQADRYDAVHLAYSLTPHGYQSVGSVHRRIPKI